jgi:hypothetical protein
MNRTYRNTFSIILMLTFYLVPTLLVAAGHAKSEARAQLLQALEAYQPGSAPDADVTRSIDAAAAKLEQLVGPPDLQADASAAAGQWLTLFSSQGIFGEIDLSFMTRAMPGGGAEGGTARIEQVVQELRPAQGFYRNMMVMQVGSQAVPALYIATADLSISATQSNLLEVRFRRIEFVPGSAAVSPAQLRSALKLAEGTPLALEIPLMQGAPASDSTVTYLDGNLRINRGKDYFAVMRRLQ